MKTLYKFVGSKDAVTSIAQGYLKFTRIEELNDPSELVPFMDRNAVRDSLNSLRATGYTEHHMEWLACQDATLRLLAPETQKIPLPITKELANQTLKLSVYDDLDFMEGQLIKAINLIRSRVGILSLTERFDSLPMWAHYGSLAKGYVLRFNDLNLEFPGDETGSLNAIKPVRYVQDIVGLTHDPSTQDNLFFCKFQDWSYEREWRVVSALSSSQMTVNETMHLMSVSRKTVTGVICGWNVPDTEVQILCSKLEDINPGIEICSATFDRGYIGLKSICMRRP